LLFSKLALFPFANTGFQEYSWDAVDFAFQTPYKIFGKAHSRQLWSLFAQMPIDSGVGVAHSGYRVLVIKS
jgi:hypothetical protein